MKSLAWLWLSCCLVISMAASTWAQSDFTDHKPQYRKWQDSYILDKIEYTKDRIIFYFRFVHEYDPFSGFTTEAVFYPPGGDHPWYLRGKNVRKDFELKEIRNVRRNGELLASKVRSELRSPALAGKNTVFTCEVHFERTPNDVEYVDFIEGRGKENATNHFNCFNVKLKTFKDKDLGTDKDSDETIKKFNDKYGVKEKPHKNEKRDSLKTDPKPTDLTKKDDTVKKDTAKTIAKVDTPKKSPTPTPTPNKVPNKMTEKSHIKCNERLIAENLKFQDNSTEFLGMANAQRTLVDLLEFLHDNPSATLNIEGHTDIHGDKDKNLELSKQRAIKIQRWFISNGLPARRVNAEWFGSTKPLKPEGDAINRRVEILVKCP